MFVRETASADDDPAGPAVRQNEAVFGFEGSMRRARAIESRVDRGPFIRMDARADQIARERERGIKSVNGAALVAHPGGVSVPDR